MQDKNPIYGILLSVREITSISWLKLTHPPSYIRYAILRTGRRGLQVSYHGFQFFEQAKAECLCRKVVDIMNNAVLEISFPEEGKVRSRKIVSRSRARATGKYPSWKMRRMMQWESVNELNAYRLLDADPAAISYHEQPLTIRYQLDGEVHLHYPDTLVQWGASRELWEIKPSSHAFKPEVIERTRLLEVALPKLGFSYRMILAEDLAQEPRLSNVLTLLKFGRAPMPELIREQLRQAICAAQEITWGAVKDGVFGRQSMGYICRLILEGNLHINLEMPLTRFTPITWVEDKKRAIKER